MSRALRIAYFGGTDFAVPPLRQLTQDPAFEVLWAASPPPKPSGRGLEEVLGPVATACAETGLPFHHLATAAEIEAELYKDIPDFAVVCAYGVKLSAAALALPRRACVNIHSSLLPRWRGAAPIERAIEAGDQETGITTMLMAERIDAGHILRQEATPIGPADTGGELHERLSKIGAGLIATTLRDYDAITPQPQDAKEACYARKLSKDEAQIRWTNNSAEEIERLARAFNPRPSAWATLAGQRLKILRAEALDIGGTPGTVSERTKKAVAIACQGGSLRPLEVQPSGGRPMKMEEWLRGRGAGLALGDECIESPQDAAS